MGALNLRKLGVFGSNLPTKKALTVQPSDFLIGGLLIESERKYNRTFEIKSPEEYQKIFGGQVNPNNYGVDSVNGFFSNVVGVSATLYVQSLIGYDTAGDAIDAVVASRDKADVGADADAYLVQGAYQEELEYGVSGNRTGTKFIKADRFNTLSAGTVSATGVSEAVLDSVIGIRVGDIILFKTASGASPVYKVVTKISESENKVFWSGDFEVSGGSAETLADNDEVAIEGFMVKTYRKSINGVETEVETELGKIICSTEAEVTDFYVENIHQINSFIKITEASASTLGNRLPADDTTVTYLTSGADGTTVASVEAQTYFLSNLDNDPIRFIGNVETTDVAMQKAIETYCKGRGDNPIAIINIAQDQSKSQLITIGNGFQRSDDVLEVVIANWLEVVDPFSTSSIAPNRVVPNVGFVMGAWIRGIGLFGVHTIPATSQVPLYGVLAVNGDQFLDDQDRTDLAENGINIIQFISGVGIKIGNLFTPSIATEFLFANGILMRNFIKISTVDSLASSENTPNSLNRISADKMAVLTFMYSLWFKGSTGDIPEGETFGQALDGTNKPTKPQNHFQVIADTTNNPQSSINLGERNVDIYFTYPTPAGSIEIGVGILLRS